ncbi:hypothetical protein C2G38_2305905 [Gigaspora rosea]|uniref:Uncharacterized protein n=1 Tax=Gigaspora rosea TaxID=44941 RepID=A0A397W4X4_9GLOM|nr:hypothetical protein C2G38_2305905 [Gigaspora rosea]
MDPVDKTLESDFEDGMKVEKETSIKYQESDEIVEARRTDLELKEKIVDGEDLEESDSATLVDEDGNNKEKDNRTERPLEKEALHCKCDKWIRRVNELRNTVGETKESIGIDLVKAKDSSSVADCYRDEIGIKMEEPNVGYAEDGNSSGQFDPDGLCCRNGIGPGKAYEYWEKVNEFLRQVDNNLSKDESITEKALIFDAASGQVIRGSMKMETEPKGKEKVELAKNSKNLTKEVALYLPLWSKPMSFNPGGMFVGRSKELKLVSWNSTLSGGEM